MTGWARAFCGVAGALIALSAQAQDDSDRARLDDFAIPSSGATLAVEQVSAADTALLLPQSADRTLGQPLRTEAAGAMPAQIPPTAGRGDTAQLNSAQGPRSAVTASVSSTADSAPGAIVRIRGADRCDPQLAQKFYAECLKILELRANEFGAPQTPQLSAEQRLLAETRQTEDRLTGTTGTLRLRFANGMDPDADLRSNQELAAIYLNASPAQAPAAPAPQASDAEASLIELLKGLGIEAPPPSPGG